MRVKKVDLTENQVIGHDEAAALCKELSCLYFELFVKSSENVELTFAVVAMFLCDQIDYYLIAPPTIKQILSSLTILLSHSNR